MNYRKRLSLALTILPDPFEWIRIPAGQVGLRYGAHEEKVTVNDFFIAKYPITNEQFDLYLKSTGQERFQHHPLKQEFKLPLHPVIELWWHEAMQFCEWVSDQVGYLITLPTNAEWQRAAQGDDDRRFPWGDEWDSDRCNSSHNHIPHTTPVNQYPQGASPYGVMDMAGNVEEWCLTDVNSRSYEIPQEPSLTSGNQQIFRGGHYGSSWGSVSVYSEGAISANWYSYSCGIRLVTRLRQKEIEL